jgi:hypothetical protein
MGNDPFAPEADEPAPRRWHGPFTWAWLLALGWLVYELTAQPALGILSVCLKFGWERFKTAWWLLRTDPVCRRAWACCALYTASALWRVAGGAGILYALFLLEMIVLIDLGLAGPQVRLVPAVVATTVIIGVTALCAAAAGCAAFVLAALHGIKVWLHPSVDVTRRGRVWPPPDRGPGDRNRAEPVLAFGAGLTLMAVWIGGLCGLDLILMQLVDHATRNILTLFVAPVAVFVCAGGGLRGPRGRDRVARLLAARPSECWGAAGTLEGSAAEPLHPSA